MLFFWEKIKIKSNILRHHQSDLLYIDFKIIVGIDFFVFLFGILFWIKKNGQKIIRFDLLLTAMCMCVFIKFMSHNRPLCVCVCSEQGDVIIIVTITMMNTKNIQHQGDKQPCCCCCCCISLPYLTLYTFCLSSSSSSTTTTIDDHYVVVILIWWTTTTKKNLNRSIIIKEDTRLLVR